MSPVEIGNMQIRARVKDDLYRLIEAFSDLSQSEIIETPLADYRWRVVITPSQFTSLLMKLSADIDYGNFKNACAENGLDTGPHHRVWSIMMAEQQKEEERPNDRWEEEAFPAFHDIGEDSLLGNPIIHED